MPIVVEQKEAIGRATGSREAMICGVTAETKLLGNSIA
jgi:hypothetical protein